MIFLSGFGIGFGLATMLIYIIVMHCKPKTKDTIKWNERTLQLMEERNAIAQQTLDLRINKQI